MNKLEATLALVIILLLFVILGMGCHIADQSNAILDQRVSLFKECVQDFGVRNCTF